MDIERLVMEHKKEKDRNVADRILLIILIQRDNMYITKAARHLNRSRSWGVKWNHRYQESGIAGLQDKPRSGRPPKVYKGIMRKIRKRIARIACWEVESVQSFINEMTGIKYNLTYSDARKDLQKINVYTFILGILL